MKKFLLICIVLFLPFAQSDEVSTKNIEVILPNDELICNENFSEKETIFEKPIELNPEVPVVLETEEVNPYSKEALKGIIEKEYDIHSPEGMFKEQLKVQFNKGIIKEAGSQVSIQTNFTQNVSDESNLKFNTALINAGLKGKFRSQKEGFNLLFDVTPDIKQNFFHRFVLDAYLESKRIPNNTLMFGTSRPTVGFEGGQSPYTLPFIFRSQTARNFGNIRKTGLRIKGNYKYVDYDLGGYSSDTWYSEFFPGVETDLWVNLKPFASLNEKYSNLHFAGGIATGSRNSVDFLVTSAAVRYNYKKFGLMAEYQNADGSNGASGLTDKKRWGYNLTLTYLLTKKLELLFRFDDFDSDKNIANNNTREYTGGINYYILGQTLRLCLNYIFCDNEAKSNSHKIILGAQMLL